LKKGGYPRQGLASIGALRAVYAKTAPKLHPAVLFRSGWKTGLLKCPGTHDLDLALDRSTPQKAIYAVTVPAKISAAAASARAKGPSRQTRSTGAGEFPAAASEKNLALPTPPRIPYKKVRSRACSRFARTPCPPSFQSGRGDRPGRHAWPVRRSPPRSCAPPRSGCGCRRGSTRRCGRRRRRWG